eukprot:scaffold83663_cov30-Phaeocystis_antarctica.AAC.2
MPTTLSTRGSGAMGPEVHVAHLWVDVVSLRLARRTICIFNAEPVLLREHPRHCLSRRCERTLAVRDERRPRRGAAAAAAGTR